MNYLLRAYHILSSAVAIYTLGFILYLEFDLVNFFSHISNLVNILAAVVFLYLGVSNNKNLAKLDSLRGATVVYTVTIGLAFIFLQERQIGALQYPWISFVQHKLIPLVLIFEWLILPPKNKIKFSESFKWLLFPIAYFAYTQIYGYFFNWYPYTFIDPWTNGYLSVFIYFIGVAVGGYIISLITIFIGNSDYAANMFTRHSRFMKGNVAVHSNP